MLQDIAMDKDYFGLHLQSIGNKSKNRHMGYYLAKKFHTVKEIINEMKRQPTEWKKIFVTG